MIDKAAPPLMTWKECALKNKIFDNEEREKRFIFNGDEIGEGKKIKWIKVTASFFLLVTFIFLKIK